MRRQLIDIFDMPKKTIFNRKIAKKQFYEQGQLTPDEKELLTTEIESIYLLAICKQDTIKISKYVNEDKRYEEIYWLSVSFKTINRYERMVKLFHKVLPNPIVIIASDENENISISAAHKRINNNDETKIAVGNVIQSPWIKLSDVNDGVQRFLQRIRFNNLSYSNLWAFYESVHSAITMSLLIENISTYPKISTSSEELLPLITSFNDVDKSIDQLRQLQKEQLDFGGRWNSI
ncbi:hypothetical protein CFK37_19795 [Virgibacillus phasianinus]|uniref:Uncharacterized protein n=1 Tax=Virgibacillus phasianinus TaxID=2017483 RepID=A0A220U7X4_9BACI|nr:DUF4391 domain-containing protein [Virgibacillus phasianinus]ASK64229.1 hypothetical protein CFK37_19795 [Virgibacillus phasianinus]